MDEWWSYRLENFLLFSPKTYYRLFELYNTDIWPIQILAFVLGTLVIVVLRRNPPWQGRAISAILALCWLWVAWAYHLQRYATINWAANYFAIGFFIEAALLMWIGAINGRLQFRLAWPVFYRAGLAVFLFALLVQPCIAPLLGRKWLQTEIFGIAPDPTVIATLGMLLLAVQRVYWELLLIPLLWCIVSGALLWTMKSPDAFIMLLAALLIIVLAVWKHFYGVRALLCLAWPASFCITDFHF